MGGGYVAGPWRRRPAGGDVAGPGRSGDDGRMRTRRAVGTALVTLLAVVVAACSDDTHRQSTGRATGEPLVVGMINMEEAPTGSFPELRRDAEAAVRYVNEELGGVNGRPIQLEVCHTAGTPESSQACATRLRARNPVAVLGGIDFHAGSSLPVFESAGIPYVGMTPALGDELASRYAFLLAGGLAADLLAQTEYITTTLGATKVGVVHLDLPGLQGAAILAARAILQQKGVTDLRIVSEKGDAADFVPAVRSATANNPEVLLAVFPAQGCTRVLQAAQSLRVRARLFLPSACAAQQVFDAAGSAANGVTFASGLVPYTESSHPEVATYLEKLREHGPGDASPSVLSQAGFSLVMNLHRLLTSIDGAPTGEALTKKLRSTRDEPSFMGHPYTCDMRQMPLLPAVCSGSVQLLRHEGGGRFANVSDGWVTGAELLKLLTG
jgi:branched-chain amino acid transport system substrate-binding protein